MRSQWCGHAAQVAAESLAKVIETDEEYQRLLARLSDLDVSRHSLSAEEEALAELLARLISDYEDRRFPIPQAPPHQVLQFLMEQPGLRQADLAPIVGSRSQVSDILSGKRGISKAAAKKLAAFFRVSAELFL